MEMISCPQCGTQYPDAAPGCPNCGHRIQYNMSLSADDRMTMSRPPAAAGKEGPSGPSGYSGHSNQSGHSKYMKWIIAGLVIIPAAIIIALVFFVLGSKDRNLYDKAVSYVEQELGRSISASSVYYHEEKEKCFVVYDVDGRRDFAEVNMAEKVAEGKGRVGC